MRGGDEKKIGVEQINVDPTGDIRAQFDGFFKNLIELIMKTDSKDIFLPGGGDIPVPDFFMEFCRNYGVNIHIISIDTLKEFINID